MCQATVYGAPWRRRFSTYVLCTQTVPHISTKISPKYISPMRKKKRAYNERIIQVEKGSFTPIVLSTFGGMGEEAARFHKRLSQLISEKRNEQYSHVVNYVRTRLRFCLLKSVLTSLRGIRGRNTKEKTTPISDLSFNLMARS